jgi:hypothetical protein
MNGMRCIRAIGLGGLVVLMACAAAVAGASAAVPERGKCVSGKEFENKGCTVSGAANKFKWEPNVKTAFSSTSGASITRSRTPEGTELPAVECAKSKSKGDYIGPKGSEFTTTFEGCVSAGERCTGGAKAKAGEIVTNKLEGTLGFISPGVVGEDVKAVGGGVIASFKCGPNDVEIDGSVIGEIGSGVYNVAASSETLTFRESGGKQEPTKLEGGSEDTLKAEINALGGGSFPFPTTTATTTTVKPGLEIKTEEVPRPKWWVEGKLLVGVEALAETTTVPPTEPFELNMTGKGIATEPFTIRCSSVRLENAEIEGPSTRREEHVVYENCIAVGKTECNVATTPTQPLQAHLEGTAGNEKLRFVPQSGKEIANYVVTGSLCKVKGEYEADGEMICNYEFVETEKLEHPLEFTATSGSKVKVRVNHAAKETAVPFTGTDEVHLASGKNWSAF